MAPKKKSLPLAVSQRLLNEERLNVARRTQQRIAQLFAENEESIGQENKQTQTDCTAPEYSYLYVVCKRHLCLCLASLYEPSLLTVAVP